jgi:hypothetical protein
MSDQLTQITNASDPGEVMKKLGGEYSDNWGANEKGQEGLLPQASLPTGTDPSPFTLKEKAPTQR